MPHQRTERWKWVRRIALCLVLGAVINVGVAWGCAAWSPMKSQRYIERYLPKGSADLPGWAAVEPPWFMANMSHLENGLGRDRWSQASMASGGPWRRILDTHVAGLPMRSLRGVELFRDEHNLRNHVEWRWAIRIDDGVLPYQPMLLGFTLNTLIYGAFALPLTLLPSAIRRRRRARKGLCTTCGYDIAGLATCPECGSASAHSRSGSHERGE